MSKNQRAFTVALLAHGALTFVLPKKGGKTNSGLKNGHLAFASFHLPFSLLSAFSLFCRQRGRDRI